MVLKNQLREGEIKPGDITKGTASQRRPRAGTKVEELEDVSQELGRKKEETSHGIVVHVTQQLSRRVGIMAIDTVSFV